MCKTTMFAIYYLMKTHVADIRYHSSTGFESIEAPQSNDIHDTPSPHRSSVASRLRFFEQLSNKSTIALVG
jgi:hypothetical protein